MQQHEWLSAFKSVGVLHLFILVRTKLHLLIPLNCLFLARCYTGATNDGFEYNF